MRSGSFSLFGGKRAREEGGGVLQLGGSRGVGGESCSAGGGGRHASRRASTSRAMMSVWLRERRRDRSGGMVGVRFSARFRRRWGPALGSSNGLGVKLWLFRDGKSIRCQYVGGSLKNKTHDWGGGDWSLESVEYAEDAGETEIIL